MKANFRNGYKMLWLEWAMLLLSIGIIVETFRHIDLDLNSVKEPSGAGCCREQKSLGKRELQAATPASWRQLAEEALLLEMSLKEGELTAGRDWTAFGVPPDEVAFLGYCKAQLESTPPCADERLSRLLEARSLYQSVGHLMQQHSAKELFFASVKDRYQIPIAHSRWHYLAQQPSTAGQWATFVAQHRGQGD